VAAVAAVRSCFVEEKPRVTSVDRGILPQSETEPSSISVAVGS
jgi:hypothetical protein